MRALVVVEADADFQDLIASQFSLDSGFTLVGVSATAEDAFKMAQVNKAALIVLDHVLAGELTGLEAAPKFKVVAPLSKIILFTAHTELREAAAAEPAVDAFVLKTGPKQLLVWLSSCWTCPDHPPDLRALSHPTARSQGSSCLRTSTKVSRLLTPPAASVARSPQPSRHNASQRRLAHTASSSSATRRSAST
jgi:DNA-binding NtrC family response regulator